MSAEKRLTGHMHEGPAAGIHQRMKSLTCVHLGVSYRRVVAVTAFVLLAALACGSTEAQRSPTGSAVTVRAAPDARGDAAASQIPVVSPEAKGTTLMQSSDSTQVSPALPQRSGPSPRTTGSVPHTQIDVDPVPEVHDELFRRTFALPDVENRPTIVSLPGARGVWINDGVSLAHPEGIVAGREFAHIHPDGSLHTPLPYKRAIEAVDRGWAERHPWADQREGWEGLVMLYTPRSLEELDVVFQLIVESYNFVTGRNVEPSDF